MILIYIWKPMTACHEIKITKMIFRKIGFNVKLSNRWPSKEFPPLFTLATSENKWTLPCSIYAPFFKNKLFVRSNHIIKVWKGIHGTMCIVPVRCTVFKFLTILANFHHHSLSFVLKCHMISKKWWSAPNLKVVEIKIIFAIFSDLDFFAGGYFYFFLRVLIVNILQHEK